MFSTCLKNVKNSKPLIHNITNYVTVNDVANAILAIGASPIMSDELTEIEDIDAICSALNLNIGTLNERTIKSMFKAGEAMKKQGKPIILDPVGAGASKLRTETSLGLWKKVNPIVIKGNMSEIKSLIFGESKSRGVDVDELDKISADNIENAVSIVKAGAKKFGCIIAATGEIDLVSDGEKCFVIKNGRAEMETISGTGCIINGIVAAFVVANSDNALEATAAAIALMGYCGEEAWRSIHQNGKSTGSGSYKVAIIDALNYTTPQMLDEGTRYEIR